MKMRKITVERKMKLRKKNSVKIVAISGVEISRYDNTAQLTIEYVTRTLTVETSGIGEI